MKEADRYLENAEEILESAPEEDGTYLDVKPVQEACGTAYLAVLKAIDQYLETRGVVRKNLPRSVDGYRGMLRKYCLVRDGKLLREFDKIYDMLHIAGYYRGLLKDVNVVRDALKAARHFIGKMK